MSRILLIEDNHDLAFGLSNNLEIEGHEVELAADGREGLARIRSGNHALILLDLMLPEMDGFRVLRTIRQEGIATPVLILTARGEELDKVQGLRPAIREKLVATVASELEAHRVHAFLRGLGLHVGGQSLGMQVHEVLEHAGALVVRALWQTDHTADHEDRRSGCCDRPSLTPPHRPHFDQRRVLRPRLIDLVQAMDRPAP